MKRKYFPRPNKRTHGLTGTPEHNAWLQMNNRCNNPNNYAYKNYGGRGIIVCDKWKSFVCFLSDMGNRPTSGHSLDRINNDGDYAPENCRWATRKQQSNNRRINVVITFNGITLTKTQWARQIGISPKTLHGRLHRGWSIERALTETIHRKIPVNH